MAGKWTLRTRRPFAAVWQPWGCRNTRWRGRSASVLAFLKPIGEGVNTNVALVCESGRIYAFLVTERDAPPHLIVRVRADPDSTTPAGVPVPAFVARSRVAEYQLMAEQSREAVADRTRHRWAR